MVQSQLLSIPDGTDTSLVDLSLPAAVDSTIRWQYRESTKYDLDGDGIQEKIVILANVGKSSSGELTWDDGQPWEVRIEEADGTTTRVFAQSVQLGKVQGYITHRDGHTTLYLLEQTTSILQGFEISYFGPNKVKSRVIFTRTIERFVKKTDGPR
jgi:hypothetical protein